MQCLCSVRVALEFLAATGSLEQNHPKEHFGERGGTMHQGHYEACFFLSFVLPRYDVYSDQSINIDGYMTLAMPSCLLVTAMST